MFSKLMTVFILTLLASSLYASSLTVAVAANVRFAFAEIASLYEKNSGVKIIPIVASSGKLTAQIEQGAPFDLFLSANMKYPNYLYEEKLAINEAKIYAYGALVLWSLNDKIDVTVDNLKNGNIKKIAIPNPQNAPYGVEAMKFLDKKGLKELLFPKLVFGSSISQTNQYIYSRAADIGITAKSVVLSPKMKNQGTWININKNDYTPIKQGVVILKYGFLHNKDISRDFYNFLFSKESTEILEKYGYILP
jgi:molybdate transport system substrate-binding protein